MLDMPAAPFDLRSSRGGLVRHTRDHPCPVCGGWSALPRHQGVRCAGMTGDVLVWCTRPEYAGHAPLDLNTSPPAYRHHRFGWCPCGTEHDHALPAPHLASLPRLVLRDAGADFTRRADVATRHEVYEYALDLLGLRSDALADLTRRGLDLDAIDAVRYRSVPANLAERRPFLAALVERFGEVTVRGVPGFVDRNGHLYFWQGDGYVIPYRDEHGRITGLQCRSCSKARYLTARKGSVAEMYHVAGPVAPGGDLFVTEGGLKAAVAAHRGQVATFGVPGQTLTLAHLAVIERLAPGRVIVALDQEANRHTAQARERWSKLLALAPLATWRAVWEGADVGGPKGLDDLFHAGGRPRLRPVTVIPPAIGARRVPRPTDAPGPIEAGGSLGEARAVVREAVDRFPRAPVPGAQQPAQLLCTPPGTGKTFSVGQALDPASPARIAVGTTALAAEVAMTQNYGLVTGRDATNCMRIEVVQALAENGHDVARLACGTVYDPRCPERRNCPYWRQFERSGPLVGAAEQLYNPTFLREASVVIADDADLPRAMLEAHVVTREFLARAIERL